MKFVTRKRTGKYWATRAQKWDFVLIAENGQVVATSEKYFNKQDMLDTIHGIIERVGSATIEEVS